MEVESPCGKIRLAKRYRRVFGRIRGFLYTKRGVKKQKMKTLFVSSMLVLALLVAMVSGVSAAISVTAYRDGAGYGGGDLVVVTTHFESDYDLQPDIEPVMGNIPTVTKVTAKRVGGKLVLTEEVLPAY